jgi:peptide chain release factor 2
LPAKLDVIASLEAMMAQPDFWNNSDKAQQIVQQLKSMKVVIEPLKKALQACDDLSELAEMLDDDPSAEAEVLTELSQLELAVERVAAFALGPAPAKSCGAARTRRRE